MFTVAFVIHYITYQSNCISLVQLSAQMYYLATELQAKKYRYNVTVPP